MKSQQHELIHWVYLAECIDTVSAFRGSFLRQEDKLTVLEMAADWLIADRLLPIKC